MLSPLYNSPIGKVVEESCSLMEILRIMEYIEFGNDSPPLSNYEASRAMQMRLAKYSLKAVLP
jgi:hypothetical protein